MFSARRTRLIYIFSSDCLPFTILPSIVSWSTVEDHFLYFKSAFIPSKIIGSYLYIHVQSIVQIVIDIISTYTFSKMSFNSFLPLQWEDQNIRTSFDWSFTSVWWSSIVNFKSTLGTFHKMYFIFLSWISFEFGSAEQSITSSITKFCLQLPCHTTLARQWLCLVKLNL